MLLWKIIDGLPSQSGWDSGSPTFTCMYGIMYTYRDIYIYMYIYIYTHRYRYRCTFTDMYYCIAILYIYQS